MIVDIYSNVVAGLAVLLLGDNVISFIKEFSIIAGHLQSEIGFNKLFVLE